jgi:hypothetical protein
MAQITAGERVIEAGDVTLGIQSRHPLSFSLHIADKGVQSLVQQAFGESGAMVISHAGSHGSLHIRFDPCVLGDAMYPVELSPVILDAVRFNQDDIISFN